MRICRHVLGQYRPFSLVDGITSKALRTGGSGLLRSLPCDSRDLSGHGGVYGDRGRPRQHPGGVAAAAEAPDVRGPDVGTLRTPRQGRQRAAAELVQAGWEE